MTSKIKIVTDSSVQLTPAEIEQYQITVIPLTIVIDDDVYTDGVDLSRSEFMDKMGRSRALPQTSQPSIGTILDCYDRLTADGSQVISIHMTETISGTVNAARQAAQISRATVTVIDSEFTDRAMAFQVLRAAELAQQGATLMEIVAAVEQVRSKTELYMSVTSLTNMVKGGRLSRVSGMLSSLLNIKVILQLHDSQLEAITKGRGMKTIHNFYRDLVKRMAVAGASIKMIGISHADALELADQVKDQLQAVLPQVPILVAPTSPVIATHTGPGAIAVMFYQA
ncbi:DegV family protein [Lapidilactobacillus luobeiensis]|uniref:DegV family protein n=1 Tax=Lapidilactobacillus luobeiensis TaxID=2950371 RepID=UPI0021C4C437|nr:DegV family protein [Lapidilactobacillus luobeiensis]